MIKVLTKGKREKGSGKWVFLLGKSKNVVKSFSLFLSFVWKRGVLSEDGIWNLLAEVRELEKRLKK